MTGPRLLVLACIALLGAASILAFTIRVHADPPTTQTGNAASRRDSLLVAPQPWIGETTVQQELAPPARPVAGAEQNPCPPSREYTLEEVTIECAERSGRFGYNLRLTGAGSGTRERWSPDSKRVERFRVPPEGVFELLRIAYQRRFFDLQPSYTQPPSIHLDPDGRVQTLSTLHQHNPPSRSVTVRIGTCTKTVSWSRDPDSPVPEEAAFLGAAADSLATMALGQASKPDSLDQLPPWASWGYPAMLAAIPLEDVAFWKHHSVASPVKLDSVRLLASYSVEQTDTQFTQVLLWFRILDAEGKPMWGLEQAANYGTRGWGPTLMTDVPWSPIRIFTTRPTNDDVYELLKPPSSWQFESEGGYPIAYGHVRENTWKTVIGQAPTKRYHRGGASTGGSHR